MILRVQYFGTIYRKTSVNIYNITLFVLLNNNSLDTDLLDWSVFLISYVAQSSLNYWNRSTVLILDNAINIITRVKIW